MSAIKKRGGLVLLLFATLMWQACDPPGPSALLRGERLIQDGKYQSAIRALQEATTLLPNNPQAWNHLGLAYHWERQYNQAVQAYREALNLNYELAPARFNLGSLLLEINQPKLAVKEFEAYTLLRKDEPEGWFRLGMAEWRDRRWDAAYESFQESLGLNPAQPIVWNSIGVIELYRKNPTGADRAFREALKHQANYAPAIYNTAIVSHFHLPRSPGNPRPYALEKYRQYLSLQPAPLFTDAIRGFADRLDKELNPRPAAPVVTTITNRPQTNVAPIIPIAPPTNAVVAVVSNTPAPTNRVVVVQPSRDDPKTNVVITPTNTVVARVEPKEPVTNPILPKPATNVVVTPAGGLTKPSNSLPVHVARNTLPPPPLENVTVTQNPPPNAPAPPANMTPVTAPNPNLAATATA
ncbi:MAG: tetratricopeptide repeat protein, partial [Limisphaerales bacterium]